MGEKIRAVRQPLDVPRRPARASGIEELVELGERSLHGELRVEVAAEPDGEPIRPDLVGERDAGGDAESPSAYGTRRMWVALALAVAAGAAIKLPDLLGIGFDESGLFYPRNMAFFTLPFIVAYFAWERPVPRATRIGLAAAFGTVSMLILMPLLFDLNKLKPVIVAPQQPAPKA